MSKNDVLEMEGVVVEKLPNMMFKVEIEGGHILLAHVSGKVRLGNIKIVAGDTVQLEISPYDMTKARITWRGKKTAEAEAPVVPSKKKQAKSVKTGKR